MTATLETRPAEPRTTLLSQIIAVRKSVKTDTEQALTKNYHLLQNKTLLTGLSRTYKPLVDTDYVYPPEDTGVQVKVPLVLQAVAHDLSRLFDVTAAMDWTNQTARADVVLMGGVEPFVLLRDVPVTYLMFLEKALVNLETLVRKLPILDPAENWEFDPASDVYRSAPVGTVKTRKIRRNHVLAAATDRHPAQVESYTEDEPVGTWTTVKFSGALPAQQVNKMLARIKALAEAVKFARESANFTDIIDPRPGARVMQYIFTSDE